MTDSIFRYLIPLACGYLTYVILSRKLLPWRPADVSARPRWLLGFCCGAIVAICLTLLMQFSFGKPAAEALAVALPIGVVSLTLFAGAMLAWLSYRRRYQHIDDAHENISSAATYAGSHGLSQNDPDDSASSESMAAISAEDVTTDLVQPTAQPDTESSSDAALSTTETAFLEQARKIAHQEHQLRCEAEKNLRITRKALLKLESEQHREEGENSEKELLLETQLRDLISSNARVENKLLREADKSGLLESRLADAKARVVEASQEVRNNVDARARAILTARKSVNFAKRSLEARDRAERQLESTRIQLNIQSETTSKILKALEREREKSRELKSKLDVLMGTHEAKGLRKVPNAPVSNSRKPRPENPKTEKSRLIRRIAESGKQVQARNIRKKSETV